MRTTTRYSRADWSIDEWEEAIRELPEGDRWEFSRLERQAASGTVTNSRRKALRNCMTVEGCALAQSWLVHRPDLEGGLA